VFNLLKKLYFITYTGYLILNDSSEYLGNEIRYKFYFCGNLFSFEGDIVLSKWVSCRWRRVGLLKITSFF